VASLEESDARVKSLEAAKASTHASATREFGLFLLTEIAASMRARTEPEYVYTAAALAGFGALAWGVAALNPEKYNQRELYLRPAGLAAIGIFLIAGHARRLLVEAAWHHRPGTGRGAICGSAGRRRPRQPENAARQPTDV
jgi:hypothetical protein